MGHHHKKHRQKEEVSINNTTSTSASNLDVGNLIKNLDVSRILSFLSSLSPQQTTSNNNVNPLSTLLSSIMPSTNPQQNSQLQGNAQNNLNNLMSQFMGMLSSINANSGNATSGVVSGNNNTNNIAQPSIQPSYNNNLSQENMANILNQFGNILAGLGSSQNSNSVTVEKDIDEVSISNVDISPDDNVVDKPNE